MKIEIDGAKMLEHLAMILIALLIGTPIVTLFIVIPAYFLAKKTFLTGEAAFATVMFGWLFILLADDYINIELG